MRQRKHAAAAAQPLYRARGGLCDGDGGGGGDDDDEHEGGGDGDDEPPRARLPGRLPIEIPPLDVKPLKLE